VIARLRGRALANTPEGLVVDVGGVGYLVAATPSAVRLADGGQEI
jgi:Holliday junction resolvasome RuvABC DNA-binding subunit